MMRITSVTVVLCAIALLSEARGDDLVLTISPTDVKVRRGEQLQVKATLTNLSNASVRLVLPGDGSRTGWRTPIISWSFISAAGEPVPQDRAVDTRPVCGNINALKNSEVFTLGSSDKRVLTDWIKPVVVLPTGHYRARMHYINDPMQKLGAIPLGPNESGVEELIRSSKACDVTSNEVSVTVTD